MTTESKKHLLGTKDSADLATLQKEWDDARCPICMDHPHNAVLLICSSRDKGCRCYVCDTSYRHSNCLDRFKKLLKENDDGSPENALKCPLCRGDVLGWMVVEEARHYLDQKVRSCSRESCTFNGNYRELRRHARRAHPLTRPGAVDPSRQRAWRRLERRQEYGDILSAIRSAVPGAIVFGDYVIETGVDDSRVARGRDRDGRDSDGQGQWWAPHMLFNMIRSPGRGLEEVRRLPPSREEDDNSVRRRRRRFVSSRSEEQNS
ncbi:hypothetical protein LUZ63_011547 [Rhynchospora breviuscula]|uniref:Uncharacterized protein n=1 Tax=Rhynchospora breviuscula TaxID=2022672 RepID=A0A9Q0CJZ6_9POAL|nr:hypothetical protein LUZ63_011547 [Rhynchospora breviuscula]